MKRLFIILALLLPAVSFAAPTTNYFLNIAPTTANTYTNGTQLLPWSNLYTTYASTTGFSGTFGCLGTDCRTAWPTGSLAQDVWTTFATNQYITPTTTIGMIVNASSTIGNGSAGLTINGAATTTGQAYFAGNVGIGTTTPGAKLTITSGSPVATYPAYSGIHLSSGATGAYTAYSVGRTGVDGYFGVAGGTNDYMNGTASGDTILQAVTGKLQLGTGAVGAGAVTVLTVSGGNVGIGTTGPGAKLQVGVSGDLSASPAAAAIFAGSGTSALVNYQNTLSGGYAAFDLFDSNNAKGATFALSGPTASLLPGAFWLGPRNGNPLYFITQSTPVVRMAILDTGNVGIGTTSPFARLSIAGQAGGTIPLFAISSSTSAFATSTLFVVKNDGSVGIGTTSPYAKLSLQTGASTGDAFVVATSSGTLIGGYDSDGHRWSAGYAPTLSSCGTNPSVVGDDNSGTITVGSGVSVTTCTVTFAKAWNQTPTCQLSTDSTVAIIDISAISTTAATFGLGASLASGHIYYECLYHHI